MNFKKIPDTSVKDVTAKFLLNLVQKLQKTNNIQ